METSDIAVALAPWTAIIAALLGLVVGYLIEWHRDDRQRTRDREERRKEAQRKAITDLQVAIEEMNHGYKNAMTVLYDPEAAADAGLTETVDFVWREDAPWAQEFATAARKVRVLRFHVEDGELRKRVEAYIDVMERITNTDLTPEQAVQAQQPLDEAVHAVHERAESLIQELF
jgi:hypothetical protein